MSEVSYKFQAASYKGNNPSLVAFLPAFPHFFWPGSLKTYSFIAFKKLPHA